MISVGTAFDKTSNFSCLFSIPTTLKRIYNFTGQVGMKTLRKLVLKPTNKCFHKCLYCSERQYFYGYLERLNGDETLNSNYLLGSDKFVEAAKAAFSLGMRECLISGGDPLLYPPLQELITGIRKISDDIFIFINSIGLRLKYKTGVQLIEAGLGAWNLSVDSINPTINDRLRGVPGALEQTLKTLNLLREIRQKEFYNKFWINFMTVITKFNYKEIPIIFDFCLKEGVSSVYLMQLYGKSNVGSLMLDKMDIMIWKTEIVPKILEIIQSYNLGEVVIKYSKQVLESFFLEPIAENYLSDGAWWDSIELTRMVCHTPEYYCLIEFDGSVLPCCLMEIAHDGIMGNILRENITSIWNSERFDLFRKNRMKFCIYCSAPLHKTIGFEPALCRQFSG